MSLCPIINRAVPCSPLNRICKCHILMVLKTSWDGDTATSLDNQFQCLTTLWMKKFFLVSILNLPSYKLRLFPPVLSLVAGGETSTSLQPPSRQLHRAMSPPLMTWPFPWQSSLSKTLFLLSPAVSWHSWPVPVQDEEQAGFNCSVPVVMVTFIC